MDILSDIGLAVKAILSWIITIAACVIICLLVPAGICVGVMLLLCKLLGPVMGFLVALVLSFAVGVIIQDVS